MKKVSLLFSLTFIIISCSRIQYFMNPLNFLKESPITFPKINGIMYLTPKTFDEAIHTHNHLLLFIYADWDLHCKEIYPKFSAAAYSKEAKKYDLAFAGVDGYFYRSIGKRYNLISYPTLIHFSNYGKSYKLYNGRENTKDDFIIWMKRTVDSSITQINTIEQIKNDFENKNEISYIYFGNNNEELKIFKKKADEDIDHIYGQVKDEKIIKKYGTKPNKIAMYTPFDEKIHYNEGKIDENVFEKLHLLHKYPYLMDYNIGNKVLFDDKRSIVFLLTTEKEKRKYEKFMLNNAKKYRKNGLYFCLVDYEKETGIIQFIKHPGKNYPKVAIVDYQYGEFRKWYFNSTFNEKKVSDFFQDYVNGKYKAEMKSEKIPNEQNEVYKIVGKTFMKEVIENDKDVFVKFYSPNCLHCKRLAPVYQLLGKRFESAKDYIRIAEMNLLDNYLVYEKIVTLPTLLLYKSGKKNEKAILYHGDRSLNNMTDFIIKNAGNKISFDGQKIIVEAEELKKEKLRQEELKKEKLRQEELKKEQLRQEELKKEQLRQEELKKEQLRQEELKKEQLRQEELKKEQLQKEEKLKEEKLKKENENQNEEEKEEIKNEKKTKKKSLKKKRKRKEKKRTIKKMKKKK